MYIIPGKYDVIFERAGFLAKVIIEIEVAENDVIELGNKVLIEGDVDRDGIIRLDDVVDQVSVNGASEGDTEYNSKYDFGQKGFIALDDLTTVIANVDNCFEVEKYN